MREVLDTVRTVTGHDIPLQIGARRAGDPARLIADSTRARELLGWVPRYPVLRDIVADAWRFASQHVAAPVTGQRRAA